MANQKNQAIKHKNEKKNAVFTKNFVNWIHNLYIPMYSVWQLNGQIFRQTAALLYSQISDSLSSGLGGWIFKNPTPFGPSDLVLC